MITKFPSSMALALTALAIAAPAAHAAACTGVNVGTSQTSDFTLGGANSSACVISGLNPDQGPNGNPGGFSPSPFGTGWTLLAKMTSDTSPSSMDGISFNWGITGVPGQNGTWSFGADQAVKVDLVMAMHASNHSGSFYFDDLVLGANQTQQGTWMIKWVNNGGQNPDYSNSSLWLRDISSVQVPEPSSYLLMLAGLAVLGFVTMRRKQA